MYALHAKSLLKRGYEVKILDLRNPYCSIRWNPLEKPFEMYQEMLSLDNKVSVNEEEGYYIFENNNLIKNGETVDGISEGEFDRNVQWECHYEQSLIQPVREVIDICMNEYAGGKRTY